MRIYDLQNGLSKVLLLKAFNKGISVVELVAPRSGKPRSCFLLHKFDLSQSPVMSVTTYVKRSVTLETGHLVLGMKRIPLRVPRHVMRCVDSALAAIRERQLDPALPILHDGMGTREPFQWITGSSPHVMVAANENHRIHLINQPLD